MEQAQALAILKSGRNVFLTGSAGTGKTYVLNAYIKYLKEQNIDVSITASTGIAATHIEGKTIHAWSGIGVKDSISVPDLKRMATKKWIKSTIEHAKILIIDEISMLHGDQFEMVDTVLKYFKKSMKPFGGIQVVCCGDFFQLPPIGREYEESKYKFAFMRPAWVEAQFNICYLTKQYRQEEDGLNFILNEIRSGKVSRRSREILQSRIDAPYKEGEFGTRLYTHNFDVEALNRKELEKLGSESRSYMAETFGNAKLVEVLKKSVLTSEELELKVGAKVMFVKNNFEKGFVNGSLGEIIRFNAKGYPEVQLTNDKIIIAEEEDWSILDDGGKTLAGFSQIPLRLAWAITVHKSQGMTLEASEMDLSQTFEFGQGYVALSRLKSLEGLRLKGFNEQTLAVDQLAFKADKRFIELSLECAAKYALEELEIEAKAFVEACGGGEKAKKGKKVKLPTYVKTKELIDKGLTLEQIAEIRDLSRSTIVTHLGKIKEKMDCDLKRFKPKKAVFNKIEKAYNSLSGEEKSLRSSLYIALDKKVGYEEINLALLFLSEE